MSEAQTQRGKLLAALVKAQAQMEAAKKDAKNPHFNSKYSDLASVVEAIKQPFAANGLGWRHDVWSEPGKVFVQCILFHESGEELEQRKPLEILLPKGHAQDVGSAISYGRRYTLQAAAGLVSDDDDGNAATDGKPPPKRGPEAIPSAPATEKKTPELRAKPEASAKKVAAASSADALTDAELAQSIIVAEDWLASTKPNDPRRNKASARLDALKAEMDKRQRAHLPSPDTGEVPFAEGL